MEKATTPPRRESLGAWREYMKERGKLVDAPWIIEDEELEAMAMSFAASFASTLPPQYDYASNPFCFSEYIENTLEHEPREKLAAIEFGGPGSRLFAGFTPGFFSHTIGVCLKDNREASWKKWDAPRNHTVLEADMFERKTYQMIQKVIAEQPVGLIISRMEGAIGWLPDDPAILANLISRWYGLLRENGLLFVQYNSSTHMKAYDYGKRTAMVNRWIRFLQENYSDTIEVEGETSSFRIHKKKGAPEDLPLLPSL